MLRHPLPRFVVKLLPLVAIAWIGASSSAQGFNEGKGKPFTAKGDSLYALALGTPTGPISIHSLGKSAGLLDRKIVSVQQLGATGMIQWTQRDDALVITPLPASTPAQTVVFKIATK